MPDYVRLTKNMPDEIEKLIDTANEDLEAERLADSVNRDLSKLVLECRHFAAVIYAPGDVKIGGSTFPPQSLRTAVRSYPSAPTN